MRLQAEHEMLVVSMSVSSPQGQMKRTGAAVVLLGKVNKFHME